MVTTCRPTRSRRPVWGRRDGVSLQGRHRQHGHRCPRVCAAVHRHLHAGNRPVSGSRSGSATGPAGLVAFSDALYVEGFVLPAGPLKAMPDFLRIVRAAWRPIR